MKYFIIYIFLSILLIVNVNLCNSEDEENYLNSISKRIPNEIKSVNEVFGLEHKINDILTETKQKFPKKSDELDQYIINKKDMKELKKDYALRKKGINTHKIDKYKLNKLRSYMATLKDVDRKIHESFPDEEMIHQHSTYYTPNKPQEKQKIESKSKLDGKEV